ncbi:MAG: 2-alkenal reductase [Candidatus Moranbacteria bacterium GW2011_GWE1_36_7]|nr:MAG: 2-alkenal reductase [Candidatus Moranbacteria bacterium GW2011_GWD2_36_12]KKQ06085.1 MAG: 2-alkenal reductase [Candidatus Moranbacteria bacterium GW2011_GWE2_36_40]KKQ14961.1 MAG: 2-alkenal reductase [Candidatus Moranbacteria bacterium GW2011_GWE1_36_7]
MDGNQKIAKRIARTIFILVVIFCVGGIGGVYFDQQILPFIRTNKQLSRINFLKRSAENVTVINKTEQITIKEDDSINEIASQASNAVVNIISLSSQKDFPINKTTSLDRSGTGVLVSSDGMIVTYRGAIIEKNATYQVFLYNGNNYEAKLVGIDEFADLAYLKIDVSNLTTISFGDSSSVTPGKKVVAIGNSFGEYQNRYAVGLLSNIAKTYNLAGKTVSFSEKMEGVFESDLNNRPEYIGGPIIGYSGDMIGLIGMLTVDGQNQYFQIPSNMIQKSLQLAMQGGFESRPSFGAYYISITKEYAIANKLGIDRGARIFSPSGKQGLAIISGSSAEKAGLRINDIVVAVNGQAVNLDNPLSNLINQYKKGDKIEMVIDRGGQEVKMNVSL